MTVTLTNTSRRLRVITLVHERYCEVCGRCCCTVTPGRTPRRLAAAVTLPAGSTSDALDQAVLDLPDVARAIRAGDLRAEPRPSPSAPGNA